MRQDVAQNERRVEAHEHVVDVLCNAQIHCLVYMTNELLCPKYRKLQQGTISLIYLCKDLYIKYNLRPDSVNKMWEMCSVSPV